MVISDVDVARPHTLRADLFQKPCRRDLAFDDDLRRNLTGDRRRQLSEQKVLEDAAGALHGWRILPVPDRQDVVCGRAQLGSVTGAHFEIGLKDYPFLVALEN